MNFSIVDHDRIPSVPQEKLKYEAKPPPSRRSVKGGPVFLSAIVMAYELVEWAKNHSFRVFNHPITNYGMRYYGIIFSAINPSSTDLCTYVGFFLCY